MDWGRATQTFGLGLPSKDTTNILQSHGTKLWGVGRELTALFFSKKAKIIKKMEEAGNN